MIDLSEKVNKQEERIESIARLPKEKSAEEKPAVLIIKLSLCQRCHNKTNYSQNLRYQIPSEKNVTHVSLEKPVFKMRG